MIACLALSATLLVPPLCARPQDFGLEGAAEVGPYLNGAFPAVAPGSADTYGAAPAYPALTFTQALTITPHPHEPVMFVGERIGRVWSFDDDQNVATKELFLDLTDRCVMVQDGGFLGFTPHPNLGEPGAEGSTSVFAFYCYAPPGTAVTENGGQGTGSRSAGTGDEPTEGDDFQGIYLRLSRFEIPSESTVADPNSEVVLIQQRMYNGSHRGGHIAFGPDGFLYVPVGDQFRYETAQDLAGNLEGGILRIDVNQNPQRSHAPVRTLPLALSDEVSGAGYWIPNDNPFVDPTGARFGEYWTVGHRNPHRIGFDSVTGELWSGEVGGVTREEVNILEAGGNYGWPFREGSVEGPREVPTSFSGVLTEPAVDFTRGESTAIMGGNVYRGANHPELYGRYLCSDYILSTIYAVDFDAASGTYTKELVGATGVGSTITFGVDTSGEVLMGIQRPDFSLQMLAGTNPSPEPPSQLSQLGVFEDLAALVPVEGWIPYDLNVPFWSDGAEKSRWVAIPNDGAHDTPAEQILFHRHDDWVLPPGSVTMKHFELPDDAANPASTRRLETRFIVFTESGYYGLSYHWNEEGTEATLSRQPRVEQIEITEADGTTRLQDWHYPGRQQCLQCHSPESGGALGLRTHQLNRRREYEGTSVIDHQLRAWDHIGLLRPRAGTLPFSTDEIDSLPKAAAPDDNSASLELRAASYIDANCASCHRPGNIQRALFDARFSTPLYARDLIGASPLDSLGIDGAAPIVPGAPLRSLVHVRAAALDGSAMPPIGKAVVDDVGVRLLREWIEGLETYDHVFLGNALDGSVMNDVWQANLVISEEEAWVSDSAGTTRLRAEAFRFRAESLTSPVTPFFALRLADDTFQVLAVGTTRTPGEYDLGENRFPFTDGVATLISVPAGGTLVGGFMDALPDGSGGGGPVVPFCLCNDGGEVWRSGGASGGSISVGSAPTPGAETTTTDLRDYAFGLDVVILSSNTPPTFDDLADLSAAEGTSVYVDASANDVEGTDLVYTATGLPDGLLIDPATGEISGVVSLLTREIYAVEIEADDGELVGRASLVLTVTPALFNKAYASFARPLTLPGGPAVLPGDIVLLDVDEGAWELSRSGADLGLSAALSGFARLPSGALLLSLAESQTLNHSAGPPTTFTATPSDVVLYLRSGTSDTFAPYFDGSDTLFLNGIRAGDPQTDTAPLTGVGLANDGRLVLRFGRRAHLPGVTANKGQLVAFEGQTGEVTSGSFEILSPDEVLRLDRSFAKALGRLAGSDPSAFDLVPR